MDETHVVGAMRSPLLREAIDLRHFTPSPALVFDGDTGSLTFTGGTGAVTVDLTGLQRRVEELERRLADLAAPTTDAERAMAHAVLRGDRVAALALADRVQEDYAGG